MSEGTLQEKTDTVRKAMVLDFGLNSLPYYSDSTRHAETSAVADKRESNEDAYLWAERLYQKGVSSEDIEFLVQILNPDPAERWTAAEIVQCGYLDSY